MLTREKNKISYIHFILSILVILIHSVNDVTGVQKIFLAESGIGQFAVPLFFVISGFLFFRNIKNIHDVTKKIEKRIYTVLYPFLIWNIIYYIIHLLVKGGKAFSVVELFDVAFNYTYNPAFWFMFQLILLIAITPIVFYALKNNKYYVLFFCAISSLIVLGIDIPFINEDAIIYFSFGAFASKLYNESKIYLIEKKNIVIALFLAIFFFFVNRIALALCNNYIKLVHIFTLSIVYVRLSIAIFMFYLADLFFKYDKVPVFMNNTFFLYAIHYMIVKGMIAVMQFVIYKFLEPDYWDIVKNITFIASPIVCVVINYYLSRFLLSRFKKAFTIITGNRR